MKAELYFDSNVRGFAYCERMNLPETPDVSEAIKMAEELAKEYAEDETLHEIDILMDDQYVCLLVKAGRVQIRQDDGPLVEDWEIC